MVSATADASVGSVVPLQRRGRDWRRATRPEPSLVDLVAPQRSAIALSSPALIGARWVLVVFGAFLASTSDRPERALLLGIPVLVVAALRSAQTVRRGPEWLCALWPGLLAELAIAAVVAATTGGWHSPWFVSVIVGVAFLGSMMSSRWAGSLAAAGIIVLLVAGIVLHLRILASSWVAGIGILVLIGLTTAYASWVFARSERHRALLAKANERLAATNSLLVGLDHASPRDGEAYDARRCARSISATAHLLFDPEVTVILVPTALPGRWEVLHGNGAQVVELVDEASFPYLAKPVAPVAVHRSPFFGPRSAVRLAIPLSMHDRLVGMVILEHSDAAHWANFNESVLAEMAERATLMLDNARRFNALWVVGATEERTRVAHDLHDNLGQSMAALGLEMDILARRTEDSEIRGRLLELRSRLTGMVGELRSTMRDLRCDVSEEKDLGAVLAGLGRDLASRMSCEVECEARVSGRLSLAQEHQLLLLARQALTAAVSDAGARTVHIRWTCDGEHGVLEISHDAEIAELVDLGSLATTAYLDSLRHIEDRCLAIGARLRTDDAGSITCEVSA